MTRDSLSKREDRALHQALASVVLTQFPNPQRKDCPGTSVLRSIAKKKISMDDAAHEHVGSCSPCFSELTEMREAIHRRMLWTAGTASAAVVVLGLLITYFAFLRAGASSQEVAQPPIPEIKQPDRSVPPSQPDYIVATLDLRNVSATRALQPSNPSRNILPVEIPRGLLTLTIQLPIGSEAGSYEVEIRKPDQQRIRSATGTATIERGITKLLIDIDTRSLQPGEYEFGWRLSDFGWRNYPLLIR
jgi:hypothetical protein